MNSQNTTSSKWLSVCGAHDAVLEDLLASEVSRRIAAGSYATRDLTYIAQMPILPANGTLSINDQQLEKLRRLCQLAEVRLVPSQISSHRPFIGPVIVFAKKMLFSVLEVLLKDTLRKQRDFNAAVIAYLTTGTDSNKL